MKIPFKYILLPLVMVLAIGAQAQEIEWLSFEEAVEKSKSQPKKLLIDIYTDWCGYCKKMDKDTYEHPKIVEYINDNFYAVKFDAEQRESIEFDGHTFKFVAQGRRGVHELAVALTQNQLSGYPTTVFMDEELRVITPVPGYRNAKSMDPILRFIGEDAFKDNTWQEFSAGYKSSL